MKQSTQSAIVVAVALPSVVFGLVAGNWIAAGWAAIAALGWGFLWAEEKAAERRGKQ